MKTKYILYRAKHYAQEYFKTFQKYLKKYLPILFLENV